MSGSKTGEIVAIVVCAVLMGAGWQSLDLGPEPGPPMDTDLVEVTNWNWKRDRSGRILAVFGSVQNNSTVAFKSVILELRTEDEDKTVLGRHTIIVGSLGPNETKHFREDIPRTGLESMGYIDVKTLGR